MDTKKISALLLSLEHGSLTAAAEELGYTQSGMTHMMNSLEDELSLKLLRRSKTGVHLSPAGEELLSDMIALNEAAVTLERHIKDLKQKSSSTLKLGAYASMARQWLPAILAELRRLCPEMEVSVTMFSKIEATYSAVKDGTLDCAMGSYVPSMFPSLGWVHLRDDALVAVLPADTDFSGSAYPVEKFSGQEFLMPSGGFERDIAPALSEGSAKSTPIIRYTNLDDASLASMVAHGLGVTVLSDLVMQSITDRVIALPLEPHAYRSLGIIFNKNRQSDKNIVRFIDCARVTIAAMYGE